MRRGFTVIELMISVVLVGMFMVACFGAIRGCGVINNKGAAEAEARTYLNTMYPGQTYAVTCMNRDTDANGYVSCDARVAGVAVPLECAVQCWSGFMCNEGCKLRPMLQFQQPVGQ